VQALPIREDREISKIRGLIAQIMDRLYHRKNKRRCDGKDRRTSFFSSQLYLVEVSSAKMKLILPCLTFS